MIRPPKSSIQWTVHIAASQYRKETIIPSEWIHTWTDTSAQLCLIIQFLPHNSTIILFVCSALPQTKPAQSFNFLTNVRCPFCVLYIVVLCFTDIYLSFQTEEQKHPFYLGRISLLTPAGIRRKTTSHLLTRIKLVLRKYTLKSVSPYRSNSDEASIFYVLLQIRKVPSLYKSLLSTDIWTLLKHVAKRWSRCLCFSRLIGTSMTCFEEVSINVFMISILFVYVFPLSTTLTTSFKCTGPICCINSVQSPINLEVHPYTTLREIHQSLGSKLAHLPLCWRFMNIAASCIGVEHLP